MQSYSVDGTRKERTGWRDEQLSNRHRGWGWDCPAVDLDFVMVEYDKGLPIGLIEYKHLNAKFPNTKHATYRALAHLADCAKIPFMLVFYDPAGWNFVVYPINKIAESHFSSAEKFSESNFVSRLYKIRGIALPKKVKDRLIELEPIQDWEVELFR